MAKTHWKKLVNPNYLGAYSIEDGKDLILTIKNIRQEEVIGPDGKKEECIVCYFHEPVKPMIINSTNAKTIQKLLGSPYIEDWSGHKIQIGTERVKAFGDIVDALRVRKFLPKTVAIKCESCGGDVIAALGMSADQLAAYTAKKYKKKLCAGCATEIASKQTEPAKQEGTADEAKPE